VVELACSIDTESQTGGSVATARASHARQIKGDDSHKKGFPGTRDSGCGSGVGSTQPTNNKLLRNYATASEKDSQSPPSAIELMMMMMMMMMMNTHGQFCLSSVISQVTPVGIKLKLTQF
jgi:hypothetical protein